jgi:hypothetical protein
MEAELERRLDRIGRRQRYTLLLLVYPYLVGTLWTVTGRVDATALLLAVVPGLGIAVVAYLAALYRARTGSGA